MDLHEKQSKTEELLQVKEGQGDIATTWNL